MKDRNCPHCKKPITVWSVDGYVKVANKYYHPQCSNELSLQTKEGILKRMQQTVKRYEKAPRKTDKQLIEVSEILYQLSDDWCDWTYRYQLRELDKQMDHRTAWNILRKSAWYKFCEWVHDYRATLSTIKNVLEPVSEAEKYCKEHPQSDYGKEKLARKRAPEYESHRQIYREILKKYQVYIDVTKQFLVDEQPPKIAPHVYPIYEPGTRKLAGEYYKIVLKELVTKEMTGFDTADLPNYYEVDTTEKSGWIIDDIKMEQIFYETAKQYTYWKSDTEWKGKDENDKAAHDLKDWQENIKPILEWLNNKKR